MPRPLCTLDRETPTSDYEAFLRAKDAGKRYFYTENYTGSESVTRPT